MSDFSKRRLEDLKRHEAEASKVVGREAGVKWAETIALPSELDRLERWVNNIHGADFEEILFFDSLSWGGPHGGLVFHISGVGEGDFDLDMVDDFWESLEDDIDNYRLYFREFLGAFIEAAISAWRLVADDI